MPGSRFPTLRSWVVRLPSASRRSISQLPGCEIWRLPEGPPLPGWRSWRTNRAFPGSFWLKRTFCRGRQMLPWSRGIRGAAPPSRWFFVRSAVAAYENWLHAPRSHTEASLALSRLLAQPPSDFDNRVYAARALQQSNAEDPTIAAQMNVRRIEQLISAVEQRGARVLLFELPYSEQLEKSRSAKITRELVHTKFPDAARWLRIDLARRELRWADGVHLDERSAVIVTQSMDRALSTLLGQR